MAFSFRMGVFSQSMRIDVLIETFQRCDCFCVLIISCNRFE